MVDKQSLEVTERNVGKKEKCVMNKEKGAEWNDVPADRQSIPCLGEEEIKEIARLAMTSRNAWVIHRILNGPST